MIKKVLLTVFLFLVFFIVPKASAQEFATSYDVNFDVSENGVTTITEKIVLRNLTSRYFADQFKLIIGATQVTDVTASDNQEPLDTKVETKDNFTTITVSFNKQVAGLNKTIPINLQFKSKDFAEKQGKVWEVHAPKISSSPNLENYNLTISVPDTFGEPTLISPVPKSRTVSFGKILLNFDKSQLLLSGVSASFGTSQLFDFNLSYHLENPNLIPILTNITLPPDTQYQDVIYQKLEPKPLNVTVDEDGNYLAWYRLNRNQKLDINLVGSSKLYTYPKIQDPALSADLKKKYTQPDKYWESDNPQIKNKLEEILSKSPGASNQDKVRLIYHYVVDNLKYNSSKVGTNERLGAVTVLNNPTEAVCMEFTDLFIALTRAAGIPARELDGYAYSSNNTLRPLSLEKDALHTWPEFWDDKKGWIMVDPTWENTTAGVDYFEKLDLNHFVFATRGISSEGSALSSDVKVTFGEKDFLGKPKIDAKIETSELILAGFSTKIKFKATNTGDAVFNSTKFVISAQKINIFGNLSQNLGSIPPYGSVSFDFSGKTNSIFDDYQDKIEVLVGNQKITKSVNIRPLLVIQNIPVALILIGILICLTYAVTLGSYVKRHNKKRDSS